jgi:hypothetical protein
MNNGRYTIKEAAEFLQVSADTLRRYDEAEILKSQRSGIAGHRYYSPYDLEQYLSVNCAQLAKKWVQRKSGRRPSDFFYCPDSSVFQSRLYKLQAALERSGEGPSTYSLLLAIVGEIGDNSFGHNLGNWPDVSGIFFGYDLKRRTIVLADRGQGVLKTLQRVQPDLADDQAALQTAFTVIISGRSPESRGNGLKYTRRIIREMNWELSFKSGSAELLLAKNATDFVLKKSQPPFHGCLALIRF